MGYMYIHTYISFFFHLLKIKKKQLFLYQVLLFTLLYSFFSHIIFISLFFEYCKICVILSLEEILKCIMDVFFQKVNSDNLTAF